MRVLFFFFVRVTIRRKAHKLCKTTLVSRIETPWTGTALVRHKVSISNNNNNNNHNSSSSSRVCRCINLISTRTNVSGGHPVLGIKASRYLCTHRYKTSQHLAASCIMEPGATLSDIKQKKIFQSTAMISTITRSRHTGNSKPPCYMVHMRIPMRLRQLDQLPIPFTCLVAIILSAKGLETFTTETTSMQTTSAVHRQACLPPGLRIPPAETCDHSISRNS